ncbi:hypothetical protein [Lacipirellula parvula]|uniref:Uncharacterized protein n=1 Tax=Lacipirellula parvula TaxID=2650471 RepID=A0A5K7XB80_9BACT|nr:hypothetical protein [Lacipirellula parvula]BBO31563.1 hypothetical protein PLANPX_1175 [Lacipirellula parvula]
MTLEKIRTEINCLIGDQTRCFEDIVIDLRAIAEHASSFADAFEDEEFPEFDTVENAA